MLLHISSSGEPQWLPRFGEELDAPQLNLSFQDPALAPEPTPLFLLCARDPLAFAGVDLCLPTPPRQRLCRNPKFLGNLTYGTPARSDTQDGTTSCCWRVHELQRP